MYNRLVMSVIAVPVLVFWYQGMWMVFERSSMEEAEKGVATRIFVSHEAFAWRWQSAGVRE